MLPLILLKGKQLILIRRLIFTSLKICINQTTTFWHRWRIALYLLPLPLPGWVNYSKIEYSKNRILWATYIFRQPRWIQWYLWYPTLYVLFIWAWWGSSRCTERVGTIFLYLSTGCFYLCMSDGLRWDWYRWHHVLRPGGVKWNISVVLGMEGWEIQDIQRHLWVFISKMFESFSESPIQCYKMAPSDTPYIPICVRT